MLATIHGASIAGFVYSMEVLTPAMRPLGMIMQIFYVAGFISLSGLSLFTQTWVQISYIMSVYPLTILIIFPFIPESFRWLFSKHNLNDGLESLNRFLPEKSEKSDIEKMLNQLIDNEDEKTSYSMGQC